MVLWLLPHPYPRTKWVRILLQNKRFKEKMAGTVWNGFVSISTFKSVFSTTQSLMNNELSINVLEPLQCVCRDCGNTLSTSAARLSIWRLWSPRKEVLVNFFKKMKEGALTFYLTFFSWAYFLFFSFQQSMKILTILLISFWYNYHLLYRSLFK